MAKYKWTDEEVRAWKAAREREKNLGMLGRLLRMLLMASLFNRK